MIAAAVEGRRDAWGSGRQRTGQFKARVVLEALKGQKKLNEIASRFGVHPVQLAQWKKQAVEELPEVFADRRGRAMREAESPRPSECRDRRRTLRYRCCGLKSWMRPFRSS